MGILFSITALILAIIALSKNSNTNYRIYTLEKKIEELSKNKSLKTEAQQSTIQPTPQQTDEQVLPAEPINPQEQSSGQNPPRYSPLQEQKIFTQEEQQTDQTQPAYTEIPSFEGDSFPQETKNLSAQENYTATSGGVQEQEPVNIAKVFSWIGGILLVLGALFTFLYLFQKGFITLGMVFSTAWIIGAGLVAAGLIMKQEDVQTTASTLCASGVSICFISAFAAYKFNILPMTAAFIFMTATAFISFWVSVYKEKQFISFLALIAAFLTPLLLSSGQDHYIFFFTYLLIVNIPAAVIALKKNWPGLAYTAAALTLLCQFMYICASRGGTYFYIICGVYALIACFAALRNTQQTDGGILTGAMNIFAALQTAILSLAFIGNGVNPANIYYVFAVVGIINIALFLFHIKKKDNSHGIYIALGFTLICQMIGCFTAKAGINFFTVPTVYGLLACAAGLINKEKLNRNVFITTGVFIAANIFVLGLCSFTKGSANIIHLYFGAALLLTVAAFAFEALHNTKFINISALISWVFFYLFFTIEHYYARPNVGYAVLGVFALFYIFTFICKNRFKDGGIQWLSAAGVSVAAFVPVYISLGKAYFAETLGIIPAFFAVCYLLPAITYLKDNKDLPKAQAIFFAFALVFTALVMPVQFSGKWLTVMFSLYAAALCWLDNKVENKAIIPMAWIIFAVVFIRLALNPFIFEYCTSETKIFNWYMLIFGAGAGAMLVSAKFFLQKHLNFKNVLNACGGILLFWLLNIEIADYFAQGRHLDFNFMGDFAEAISYTIGWAVYGAAACIISFLNKSKVLAKCGIFIICVALVKLALDIWQLEMLYRIIGVFSLAVLLIVIAFLFQKYNKEEK